MNLMIDSGADMNIISESDWRQIKHDYDTEGATIYDLNHKPITKLRSYAATTTLEVICTFKAWVETTARPKPRTFAEFAVVRGGTRSLLGRESAAEMQLLRVGLEVNSIGDNESHDEDFPAIPDVEVDFDIDDSVPPVRHAYVSIPVHYRQPASERLAEMTRQGIIERVRKAPKWISGLNAVPKGKDNFRLVVNMRGPNKAIRRQFHAMPRVEEMKSMLGGAKFFTKIDITSAFHHVVLSERSREMTTFMGPDGMYRFKRLVFGVNCAPEIFQRIMEDILTGIPNIIVYIDDVLAFASTLEELREITRRVLEALKRNNLTVNEKKCEYDKETLIFLGHKLSREGLSIDEEKVKDVKKFRRPNSASELRSFLGLASYVSGFIPRFADLTEPLWSASRSGKFEWAEEQDEAFNKTKEAIESCTIAQGFFQLNDKTFLYTDASPHALGAVLVQEDSSGTKRIISFASKTLTSTEKRYAQTQREALAVVWAAERFHYYLLGQKFTICTDALGIAYIFNRNGDAPKRMMKRAEVWAMRLDAFDFDIKFVKGTENIADPSSRLYTGEDEAYSEREPAGEIAEITLPGPTAIQFGTDHMPPLEVGYHTARDDELQAVVKAVETGEWTSELAPYKQVQEELQQRDGVLTRSGLAIIPLVLRAKAMRLGHKGHPGMTAMKSILRERVWWPRMNMAIESWVENCRTCTLNGRREPPTPMESTPMPEAPWDLVAVDFCGPYAMYNGILVMGMVDYHSRYMLAAPIRSTDFASTRIYLNETFDLFGLPGAIKSDNGPPFNSAEYRRYCTDRGIKMVFSWPLNPQQNGMAERAMQSIGKAMKSASVEGGDFRSALAEAMKAHNSAAHRITNEVPNDVMFGRRIRNSLPLAKPAAVTIDDQAMRTRDWEEKMKAKEREDGKRRARSAEISVGDKVVLRRAAQRKGETNYHPAELEVVAQRKGDLTMVAPDGTTVRRSITMAKKVADQQVTTPANDGARAEVTDSATVGNTRPQRTRTTPDFLKDYVRMVDAGDKQTDV